MTSGEALANTIGRESTEGSSVPKATVWRMATPNSRSRKADAAASYQCTECGTQYAKWVGRCGECQTWGSVEERGAAKSAPKTVATMPTQKARPIGEVAVDDAAAVPTGVGELDRV